MVLSMSQQHSAAPRFQIAQKAFILWQGSVLLVEKSASDPEQPNAWEVPGGRLEATETLEDHLPREVREEVGIDVEVGAPFVVWDWTMDGRGDLAGSRVRVVAVGRRCTPLTLELSDDGRTADDHLGRTRWVPLEEVQNYNLIPSLRGPMAEFLRSQQAVE